MHYMKLIMSYEYHSIPLYISSLNVKLDFFSCLSVLNKKIILFA